MIISIDVEKKAFTKSNTRVIFKTLNKIRIGGNYLILIKGIY